ncbi:MAG: isocitrate lyase/phosphoenolpyruvate mutase family protein [Rhodanobacter sp.]
MASTLMDIETQIDRAHRLRRMHDRTQLLLLPNAWDAGTARLFEQRGFAAVATTSGGMAWSLGYADGEQVPLAQVLQAVARITRACSVPVTVDFEGGYGLTPYEVAASVLAVIEAGAVGINLEDGLPGHGPLRPIDSAAARIAAARTAATTSGVPLVINARVDLWLHADDQPGGARLREAVQRAQAYLAAGADCVYPIGLRDVDTLADFILAIDAPVNVAAGPGMPSVEELARIGVARVSTATRLATLALGAIEHAAVQMRETGRFDALASAFTYDDAQCLFAQC